MKFEWGTALIGLTVSGALALPFILDYRSRTKKEKKLLAGLRHIAQQHNCKVEEHESCGDAIIGLDNAKNALVFFNQATNAAHHMDLNTVRSCQAIKGTRSTKDPNANERGEQMELCFIPKEKGRDQVRLQIQQAGTNNNLYVEMQFAAKWAALVNDRLKR